MPAFFIEQRFWCWVKFDLHAWGNNKRNLLRNEMDCNHIERIEIVPWVGREGRLPPCKWPIEEESTVLSETQHVSMFEEWHTELLPSRDFHCLQLESTFFKDREGGTVRHCARDVNTGTERKSHAAILIGLCLSKCLLKRRRSASKTSFACGVNRPSVSC